MDSAHGTRTVHLQRKRTGLGFSVKGGKEHGIPIVVSWIKENGAAGKRRNTPAPSYRSRLLLRPLRFSSLAKHLHLGDVILAVNGHSLQGMSHSDAVERLRNAGTSVMLRIRPNQTLGGEVQTGRQTDRQKENKIIKKTDKKTSRQKTERQTNRHTNRQKDRTGTRQLSSFPSPSLP